MGNKYRNYHILSTLILNVSLLISTFFTDNPMILFGELILCVVIFFSSKNMHKFRKGVIYFIPFSIVTTLINLLFAGEGNIVLFSIFSKRFTLEALLYAFVLSFKLLIVIYLFMLIDIMTDSDKAVSYFSTVIPKSILTLMISFKLFPTMRERLKNLKEVYSLRGVNFEGRNIKDKVKSYIPIMSILLESSMEGAFDIGEAAYVRGFLCGKRTVYDKQKLKIKDYLLILSVVIFFCIFLYVKYLNLDSFDIYAGISLYKLINSGNIAVFLAMMQLAFFTVILADYR
jgi:energy-coupling factor transport system permease protein